MAYPLRLVMSIWLKTLTIALFREFVLLTSLDFSNSCSRPTELPEWVISQLGDSFDFTGLKRQRIGRDMSRVCGGHR